MQVISCEWLDRNINFISKHRACKYSDDKYKVSKNENDKYKVVEVAARMDEYLVFVQALLKKTPPLREFHVCNVSI